MYNAYTEHKHTEEVDMNDITPATIRAAMREAQEAAYEAADHVFKTRLGGRDQYACGFAWTTIHEYAGKRIRGNSRVGRALREAGIRQNYDRQFQIWNPSQYPAQNVDVLEAGARAAADVFRKYGFVASAGSRLD
jgi:hypothetical protein